MTDLRNPAPSPYCGSGRAATRGIEINFGDNVRLAVREFGSAVGEKMGGVTVSAKAEGQTITTSKISSKPIGTDGRPLWRSTYRS